VPLKVGLFAHYIIERDYTVGFGFFICLKARVFAYLQTRQISLVEFLTIHLPLVCRAASGQTLLSFCAVLCSADGLVRVDLNQKLRRILQILGYFHVQKDQHHANDNVIENGRGDHVVETPRWLFRVQIALVLVGVHAIAKWLIIGKVNVGQVHEYGHEPNEHDRLERARLRHETFHAQRLANDIVAFAGDEKNGEYGSESRAILGEIDNETPGVAQIPALLGKQIVHARGHARKENHQIGEAQVRQQIVGEIAQLFFFHEHVENEKVATNAH
jgi:hypothetical protein